MQLERQSYVWRRSVHTLQTSLVSSVDYGALYVYLTAAAEFCYGKGSFVNENMMMMMMTMMMMK